MRKILYIVIAMMSLLTSSQVFAATQSCATAQQTQSNKKTKRSIMELPLFERAILIIKKFETLHKPKHWPYVGYGHQVQPGEPYRRGVQLTEAQADALLRKDYAKFCSLYEKYGKDKYLLAALAYNCGPGSLYHGRAIFPCYGQRQPEGDLFRDRPDGEDQDQRTGVQQEAGGV